jgi:two-component system, cell cycle response regulator DivK
VAAHRILIADSDGDSRTVYRIVLQHHGYDVLDAADGPSALRLAQSGAVALVITELTLRALDGHSLLEALMSDEKTAHIRVIVLTARALREDRERARNAGCVAFLTKPLQPTELLGEVRRLIEPEAAG